MPIRSIHIAIHSFNWSENLATIASILRVAALTPEEPWQAQ
jgi:hypothetical protein